ncbi:cupin domain-containing protein [Parafrankia elaeagni]|uniref:hypothetical protein n=1 Tax=Parafrankia elaeagni TaxID=222534 RepID=UPI0003A0FFA6|nr:hypothetical protein [Parafrankia elaeagni]
MPVSKPSELPRGGGGRWPASGSGFRSAQWGDMEVGYTATGPLDCTPGYQGLPGGVCPCPHYGYVFAGRVRAVYPGTNWPDEVATAGDVYFFPAGHSLIYEEPSEVLEINPAAALQQVMAHFESLAGTGRLASDGG